MSKKGYMMSSTLDLYQTLHFNINFASVQTTVKMSLVFYFYILSTVCMIEHTVAVLKVIC